MTETVFTVERDEDEVVIHHWVRATDTTYTERVSSTVARTLAGKLQDTASTIERDQHRTHIQSDDPPFCCTRRRENFGAGWPRDAEDPTPDRWLCPFGKSDGVNANPLADIRTCSYDGGLHPEDVITLVERGWRVEATTKSYKRYLHPPADLRLSGSAAQLKVYVQHFTEDQVNRINAVLAARP